MLAGRRGRTGLEFVQAVLAGELPGTAFASVVGMRLVEADEGRVRYAMTCSPHLANAMGGLHGGAIATLCDAAAGFAVISALGRDEWFTTMDLHTKMLRGAALDGREVYATGELLRRGRRTAVVEVRVNDADERLIATALSTCLVTPRRDDA